MYGIDFGTTYTVVSYKDGDKVKFLNFNNSNLLLTSINQIDNLKRLILNESRKKDIDSSLINILTDFFKYLYKEIQEQLNDNQEYKNCVITVPVRFNDLAKNLIKQVAIAANFYVVKLLSEPVAACIGTMDNLVKNGCYAVYDLGGGTFDVSLIKFEDDLFHVLKVDGIENFGGINISEYIANEYKLSFLDAEVFKKKNHLDLNHLLQKTYDILLKTIENHQINALILNGGSCYLKCIEDYFSNKFNIIKGENLQLMVSKGACLYCNDFVEKRRFLIDVTPMNLGIEVMGQEMSIIIPANSPLPYIATEKFIPINNKIAINVYQGPTKMIIDATLIYSFNIETNEAFDVTFILDYDGILTIKILNQVISLNNFYNK